MFLGREADAFGDGAKKHQALLSKKFKKTVEKNKKKIYNENINKKTAKKRRERFL